MNKQADSYIMCTKFKHSNKEKFLFFLKLTTETKVAEFNDSGPSFIEVVYD